MELNEAEAEEMRSLKNREFLVDDRQAVLLCMVDILLAFAYDHRTTSGDPTVRRHISAQLPWCSSSWIDGLLTAAALAGGVGMDHHDAQPVAVLAPALSIGDAQLS